MSMTIQLSDDVAEQLSAICSDRVTDLSSLVREVLTGYLAAPKVEVRLQPNGPVPRMLHTLDECMTSILSHWPSEIEQRLTAEMQRTGLRLSSLLVGILYDWATWTETHGPLFGFEPSGSASPRATGHPSADRNLSQLQGADDQALVGGVAQRDISASLHPPGQVLMGQGTPKFKKSLQELTDGELYRVWRDLSYVIEAGCSHGADPDAGDNDCSCDKISIEFDAVTEEMATRSIGY
jgi:hypothetical protein